MNMKINANQFKKKKTGIQKLTDVIRAKEENIGFGAIHTLKMIDDEADKLDKEIEKLKNLETHAFDTCTELKEENEKLKNVEKISKIIQETEFNGMVKKYNVCKEWADILAKAIINES